jgi:hypothetical protein
MFAWVLGIDPQLWSLTVVLRMPIAIQRDVTEFGDQVWAFPATGELSKKTARGQDPHRYGPWEAVCSAGESRA